jgi:RHS repeat-associated protein
MRRLVCALVVVLLGLLAATPTSASPAAGTHLASSYVGARYYASQTGRFTTVDPYLDAQKALVDPQQWNRYAYVRNNPLRYVDPDGRAIETAWDIISLGLSANAVWQDPTSGWNWVSLGADALSVLGPGIPAIGMVIRGSGKVDDAVKGARGAFEVASEGGRHAGFLRNYAGKTADELRRGVGSLEKEVATHLDKIKNPEKYIEGFSNLDPRQQKALLEKKWPGDIQRQREQIDILKRLLEEAKIP